MLETIRLHHLCSLFIYLLYEMTSMIEEIDWMIEHWEQETDFLLNWEVELPPLFNQDNIRYEYSQGKTKDCTLYSAIWAISDLMNYEFNKTEIKEVVDMSYARGRRKDGWWFTQLWVKCAADYWNNKYPDRKVAYYRIDILSNNFTQVLKAWYTVVLSFKGNTAYSMDHYEDWVVDWTDFKPSTRWHATTSIHQEKVFIKDSYKGRKKKDWSDDNHYELKDIVALVKNGVYYPSAYVFVAEEKIVNNVEELKRLNEFKTEVNIAISQNSKLWHLTNDEMFKENLHEQNQKLRGKLIDIEIEFKKFK